MGIKHMTGANYDTYSCVYTANACASDEVAGCSNNLKSELIKALNELSDGELSKIKSKLIG